jgi:hypothetical protein
MPIVRHERKCNFSRRQQPSGYDMLIYEHMEPVLGTCWHDEFVDFAFGG